MPGSVAAKKGRISRNISRIGSSIFSKSRRMMFQSGLIGDSSAGVVATGPSNVGVVNGLRISPYLSGYLRRSGPKKPQATALSRRLADRKFQRADAVDPALDLVP